MNQHSKIYIPEGITFGKKIVIIPSVSSAFSHGGYMHTEYDTYTWIDRHQPIGSYTIEVDKSDTPILKFFAGTETCRVSIPSPVSGLLIYQPSYDFHSFPVTAILLPDDEAEAENGEYMFAGLCDVCSQHKKYFLEPSRYWSKGAWTLDEFKNITKEQLSLKCKYVDALPQYKSSFDSIRTMYPNIRPHIKHLI